MLLKKIVLSISVILSIFVLYFGFNSTPDYAIIDIYGFKFGPNLSEFTVIKLLSLAMWGLFVLIPNSNKDGN